LPARRRSRSQPYYDRNLPKLCSFWLKGACSRVVQGDCPFRPCCGTFRFPELAGRNPDGMRTLIEALERLGTVEVMRDKSAEMEEIKEQMRASQRGSRDQNIRDRYHGIDTLTEKYIGKAEKYELTPPDDKSITTLYVNLVGQGANITKEDLTDAFYAYGEISNISVVAEKNCAFVTYTARESAEAAAKKLNGALNVKGVRLRLHWGRPFKAREMQGETRGLPQGGPGQPGMPTAVPMLAFPFPGAVAPPPGAPPSAPAAGTMVMPRMQYPSMNPNQMGTVRGPLPARPSPVSCPSSCIGPYCRDTEHCRDAVRWEWRRDRTASRRRRLAVRRKRRRSSDARCVPRS
jgi:pre-mRNA-splicing factor RBM22/SLT11